MSTIKVDTVQGKHLVKLKTLTQQHCAKAWIKFTKAHQLIIMDSFNNSLDGRQWYW